ncbi:hypothetical protein E2C01_083868 [Portunus trituberculatus]|uniref:Uncharacterized protein n=1 Tax=Portunus trituberculatus TaxID=210409 RepID=A0A5B7J3C7_PORTR|nr:hypothetical protein [Portunus trituberculatus]
MHQRRALGAWWAEREVVGGGRLAGGRLATAGGRLQEAGGVAEWWRDSSLVEVRTDFYFLALFNFHKGLKTDLIEASCCGHRLYVGDKHCALHRLSHKPLKCVSFCVYTHNESHRISIHLEAQSIKFSTAISESSCFIISALIGCLNGAPSKPFFMNDAGYKLNLW